MSTVDFATTTTIITTNSIIFFMFNIMMIPTTTTTTTRDDVSVCVTSVGRSFKLMVSKVPRLMRELRS